ncbi:NifU family protein [Spirillospora sp. CA-255316]
MAERLDEGALAERLGRIEELLATLEQAPGPTAESALDAVALLSEVYGEALGRVMDRAAADARLAAALMEDDLVGHLLALHDVHLAPTAERVRRALEGVRPYLRSQGRDVELVGIDGDVARVRLTGGPGGCGSTAGMVEQAVRDAVLAIAPELSGVEPEGGEAAERPATFIPVDALLRHATPSESRAGAARAAAAPAGEAP